MADELRCAIHQPNLFPRLSTLAKLFAADVWVVLDDVQFARRDYQHRCRLAAFDDVNHQQWLTVPVHLPNGRATVINDVRIVDPANARRRVFRLIQQYYGRSRNWSTFQGALDEVLAIFDNTDRLAEVSEASTRVLLKQFAWPGTILHSRELPAHVGRSMRLADLTCATGATTYLCGTGGARYLDPWSFAIHGLTADFFTVPESKNPEIWQASRRVSALRAMMNTDSTALAQELREHACTLPHPISR